MEQIKITFDKIPEAMEFLINEIMSLREEISKIKPSCQSKPKPIEIDDACKITLKAKSTIYRLVREGKIPHSKVGNKLYFFEDELLQWISKSSGINITSTKKEIEKLMMKDIRHKPQKRYI